MEQSSVPAAKDLAKQLKIIHEELKANLQHAQDAQAHFYNKNRKPTPELHKGQLKLDHRKLGPYPIEKRIHDTNAYKLKLLSYLSRLHPVFHVSLLEPYKDPSKFHPHSNPIHIQLDETPTMIESIKDSQKIDKTYEYLIHFHETDQSEDSWIPLSDIPSNLDETIDRFHHRHPRAPRPNNILFQQRLTFNNSDEALVTLSSEDSVDKSIPVRPTSPKNVSINPKTNYTTPVCTTTRSSRVSQPAPRLDPIIPGQE
ncbi:reverse transcriptase-rnase h-integrase [Moniliophthora roreri MCA 2997]|uniref:Reverse transcriptase-rnase h-integrase n=1 Tax=Moniliophthora roreri (strain MCA 2997) TaxID=1381753 RepID=V2XYN1_MONRO|nr:reverse transcriptase-rnase h-integrase [Moniliophthora roreri MCA 2997]